MDFKRTWPSSYVDGGRAAWSVVHATDEGDLKVSFPNVRWKALRATEGWAALQHHAVLRTALTIYPPQPETSPGPMPIHPHLRVQLIQGSYFTILPTNEHEQSDRKPIVPEWHSGNIYDMPYTLPHTVSLPSPPSTVSPTTYDILVSGDYEIRLFGDPHAYGSEIPVQSIKLTVSVEDDTETFAHEPTQDVVCDFVDGFAFGDVIGIGVRSIVGWWTVTDIVLANRVEGIDVKLQRETRIAPSQMRIVPALITQARPFNESKLDLTITLVSNGGIEALSVSIPIKHLTQSSHKPIKASYSYAQSMPTAFLVLSPILENLTKSYPPILALHGAGVDVLGQSFWADSLPRNYSSWIVIPTGRTSWGLDWHGSSAQDVWASVNALSVILKNNNYWNFWLLDVDSPVVVMGHSNGGQGAWYLASRYPDRVLGVIPAAGYIKSQAYVPLTMSRSAHFIDPALRAILESALTPDDNDLFLSNLVDMPVLAIHGGDDGNVPPWHSREAVGVLESWRQNANVELQEDPGQDHWYPWVLNNQRVQNFLDYLLALPRRVNADLNTFTLTVAVPAESGSLHGWRIEQLAIPGRLGRLRIEMVNNDSLRVRTSNVNTISLDTSLYELTSLHIDDSRVSLTYETKGTILFEAIGHRAWKVAQGQQAPQSSSRIQSILRSTAPIVLVVCGDRDMLQKRSMASRIAHDLNAYHRLDVEFIHPSEALSNLETGSWSEGNIVIIGDPSSGLVQRILERKRTPFGMNRLQLTVNNQPLEGTGQSAVFLHPHPMNLNGSMLFILSENTVALERAGRLFPIRTGVAVPDWVVIGHRTEEVGAAGLEGAGVWGRAWSWNSPLSWLY